MWQPETWSDLQALIGQAEESPSLEFKRAVTADNREIAKDIAAMTVDGGVILYGVDEDENNGRASAITPVKLAQVREKLIQVAGSRISPSPDIRVETIVETPGDVEGVVLVFVPPSSLAPHQVDGRYPRRRDTTTESLASTERWM